jgi:hypothetical protein
MRNSGRSGLRLMRSSSTARRGSLLSERMGFCETAFGASLHGQAATPGSETSAKNKALRANVFGDEATVALDEFGAAAVIGSNDAS